MHIQLPQWGCTPVGVVMRGCVCVEADKQLLGDAIPPQFIGRTQTNNTVNKDVC